MALHRARLHKFVETMTRAGNLQNRGVVRAAGAASEAKTRAGNTAPIMEVAGLPLYDLGMPVVRERPGRLSGSQEIAAMAISSSFRSIRQCWWRPQPRDCRCTTGTRSPLPVAMQRFRGAGTAVRPAALRCVLALRDCADSYRRAARPLHAAFSPMVWRGRCRRGAGSAGGVLSPGPQDRRSVLTDWHLQGRSEALVDQAWMWVLSPFEP